MISYIIKQGVFQDFGKEKDFAGVIRRLREFEKNYKITEGDIEVNCKHVEE